MKRYDIFICFKCGAKANGEIRNKPGGKPWYACDFHLRMYDDHLIETRGRKEHRLAPWNFDEKHLTEWIDRSKSDTDKKFFQSVVSEKYPKKCDHPWC